MDEQLEKLRKYETWLCAGVLDQVVERVRQDYAGSAEKIPRQTQAYARMAIRRSGGEKTPLWDEMCFV